MSDLALAYGNGSLVLDLVRVTDALGANLVSSKDQEAIMPEPHFQDQGDDLAVRVLKRHIDQGCELILGYIEGADHLEDVLAHFSDEGVLEQFGYSFAPGRTILSPRVEPTDRTLKSAADELAASSWFRARTVTPASLPALCFRTGLNGLQASWCEKLTVEVLCLHAEEWLHCLQDAAGGLVSRHGALLRSFPHSSEVDVACYLREQGIPLSEEIFLDRYARRAAFNILQGMQTEREQRSIAEAIQSLEIGQRVCIGRSRRWMPGCSRVVLTKDLEEGESEELSPLRLLLRECHFNGLSRFHCMVESFGGGRFRLSSCLDGRPPVNGIFLTDPSGYWTPLLTAQVIIGSGTRVRLSPHFEFQFPTEKN